ncbi:MAG: PDGLE domain-containing protein [Moorellaceae bacterium]
MAMRKGNIAVLLFIALLVAVLLAPMASSSPDGLERVAEDHGFLHLAEGKGLITGLMPDYLFPGIENEAVATALAGFAGTLVTFGVVVGLGKLFILAKGR